MLQHVFLLNYCQHTTEADVGERAMVLQASMPLSSAAILAFGHASSLDAAGRRKHSKSLDCGNEGGQFTKNEQL